MKILVTDSASLKSHNDLSLDVLGKFGKVFEFSDISRDELLSEVKDTDIILANKVIIDREVMENAPRLRYVGLFATGYNNIDIVAAKEKGIVVANAGSYSTNAVAQQVMAYILMHFTEIAKYDDFVKQGGWLKSECFAPLDFARFIISSQACSGDVFSSFKISSISSTETYSCTPSLVKTILLALEIASLLSSKTKEFISAGFPPPKQAVISFRLS